MTFPPFSVQDTSAARKAWSLVEGTLLGDIRLRYEAIQATEDAVEQGALLALHRAAMSPYSDPLAKAAMLEHAAKMPELDLRETLQALPPRLIDFLVGLYADRPGAWLPPLPEDHEVLLVLERSFERMSLPLAVEALRLPALSPGLIAAVASELSVESEAYNFYAVAEVLFQHPLFPFCLLSADDYERPLVEEFCLQILTSGRSLKRHQPVHFTFGSEDTFYGELDGLQGCGYEVASGVDVAPLLRAYEVERFGRPIKADPARSASEWSDPVTAYMIELFHRERLTFVDIVVDHVRLEQRVGEEATRQGIPFAMNPAAAMLLSALSDP